MSLKDNWVLVKRNGKVGKLNINGEILMPCVYDEIFGDNVKIGDKIGRYTPSNKSSLILYDEIFIERSNEKGREKWNDPFGNYGMLNDIQLFRINNKLGFWDANGQKHDAEFDYIGPSYQRSENLSLIAKDGKFGLINRYGFTVLPCIFDKIDLPVNYDFIDERVIWNDIYFFYRTGKLTEKISNLTQEEMSHYLIKNIRTDGITDNLNILKCYTEDGISTIYKGHQMNILKAICGNDAASLKEFYTSPLILLLHEREFLESWTECKDKTRTLNEVELDGLDRVIIHGSTEGCFCNFIFTTGYVKSVLLDPYSYTMNFTEGFECKIENVRITTYMKRGETPLRRIRII